MNASVESGRGRVGALPLRARTPRWSMARSDARFGLFLTAPALLIILVVVAFPLLYSLWMSLAEVNLLRTTGPALEVFGVRLPLFRFVGIENYIRVFSDPLYWSSLGRTVYFVAAFVVRSDGRRVGTGVLY